MKSRFVVNFDNKVTSSMIMAINQCWSHESIEAVHVHFDQENCFCPLRERSSANQAEHGRDDLSEIFFFGCGEASSFAGYDPRTFAKKFKNEFEQAKGSAAAAKLEVKHLYFFDIVTEARSQKRASFAQTLVNKLHVAGFKHVVVHRIEKPAKCKRNRF